MEAKNRLSRLLSKERSLRRESLETKDIEPMERSRTAPPASSIDTSPITSPENMELTRRRLSRLNLGGKPAAPLAEANPQARLFAASKPTKDTALLLREPRKGRKEDYDENMEAKSTPLRVRKRVTIQPIATTPGDEPPNRDRNRIQRRALTRARSLSPLPSRHMHPLSHYPQHEMHEMKGDEDDSVFEMDFHKFQDVDCKVAARMNALGSSADTRGINIELSAAADILRTVGVSRVQLWTMDFESSTLSAERSDGTTAQLNAYQSQLLLDFSRDSMQAFSAPNSDMLVNPPNVCTWLAAHPAYNAIRNTVMHGLHEHYYDTHTDREGGDPSQPPWSAIHALRLVCRSSDSIYFNKTIGVLVVTEISDPTLPFSAFYGMSDHNMRKLRRFLTLQLLQKLALAVENRLSMFEALNDQQELIEYIEQTRDLVTTKQIELTQKDMVIEDKEAAIRDRDLRMQCNEALVTCAALLGENKLHHSAFIASAVAKSGCIGDKTAHAATNCWFIFKEIDVMSQASSGGRYPTEHHTVCTISGHARDGYNPVSLVSGQNKLIARLLHGDVSGQSVTRVTSSRKDLFDAGLVVSELMAFEAEPTHTSPHLTQPWTVLSVPMKVSLSDKLAFDCPGHCTVLASVVITVPEGGDLDLFSAHALSLTHLARRAFESLHEQHSQAQRQNLLSIPSVFYDAVTIIRPVTASESLSAPHKGTFASHKGSSPPPVAVQPQYQRALSSLFNTVTSSDVAAKFGVRRSVLIVSDVCSSNLRLSDPPVESRKLSFLISNGSSLQTLACPTVDLSVTSWLQDLYSGKIVYFDSSENFAAGNALLEAFNVDQSLRGSVSKQSKLVSPPFWESQQLLRALVQAVDPHATFCALVPIRTASGLSVLLLIDKLTGLGQSGSPGGSQASRSEVIPFSAEYMEAVLNAGVCKDLMNCLVIVQQQCSAHWVERDLAEEIDTLQTHEDKLCRVIDSVRSKAEVSTQFARWKYSAKAQADKDMLDKNDRLQHAVLHLITHRSRVDVPDCRKSFLTVLESQFKSLFPFDSVSIRDSSQHYATVAEEDENSRAHLRRDIVNHVDSSPTPTGAVIAGGGSSSSRQIPARKVVTTVVISRPAQLNRPFSQAEVADFNSFCSIASDVYTALSRGYSNDLADGDVRSLVFPLLAQLVPALLASSDAVPSTASDVCHLLPLLVQWLKRACNADMVLLRLSAFAGSTAETLLSSEEIENSHVDILKTKLPSLAELVQLQSAAAAATSSTARTPLEVSTADGSDHILLKFLDRAGDGSAQQIGEVKILSANKKHFTAEQRTVVELVSYLLTHTIRSSARAAHIQAKDKQLRSELVQMRNVVTTSQQAIIAETHSSEAFKSRLANILSAIMFTDKVAATSSLSELASLVCDGLPKLLGVSSAVLLMEAHTAAGGNGSASTTGAVPESFRVILPRSSRPSDSLDTSSHAAMANSVMSLQQVRQVPLMFQNDASAQCRIDLIAPDSDALFGSVLIFRNPIGGASSGHAGASSPAKDEESSTYKLWEGLEDILRNALSAAIYQCTTRIAHQEQIDALTRSLSKATAILRDQEHLEPDIANLLSIKSDLEEQRNALLADVATLKGTIDEILSEKEQKLRAVEDEIQTIRSASLVSHSQSTQQIASLESSLSAERATLSKLDASKKQLLELVSSFSFDQRCEQESVLLWLRDIADSADSSLHLMSQSDRGVLRGGEGIRGIMAAVGEAVRTGLTVEFTSTVASNEGKTNLTSKFDAAPAPAAVRYTRSDGRSADTQLLKFDAGSFTRSNRRTLEGSDVSEEPAHIAVLCVPNRCAPANATAEHACFIFVKRVDSAEDKYSAEEKDLLNSAANLSSRTLVQTSSKLAERDIRLLEAELDQTRTLENRLRQVITLGEVLRQREYQSKADVSSGVDVCVKTLLARGPRDSCVVESALWLPPWNSTVDTSSEHARSVRHSHSVNADLEALNRVLSTGQKMRRRGVCWIPLFNHRNEVIAILRVERKFSEISENADVPSPQTSLESEDLPTVAHLVITDIEEEMLVTFAAFAVPLLERMDFIGEAYSGVHQAGQAILALQQVNVAIEDKYALEVSHRLELEESLRAGAEMLGMISSSRIATGQLLDATRKSILTFTSSMECFIIMPTIPLSTAPDSAGQQTSQQGIEYCTFTADLPREVAVVFEAGDLEAAAMQSFRSIATAGDPTAHPATDICPSGVRAWQSWAVRRLHAQMSFGLDVDQRQQGGDDQDMYALAVPFALRSGALAVVSVVRRSAPFSSTDRECITWVSKVLAYCLEIKGAEETLAETVVQVGALQEEITRLKAIDQHLTELEEDNESLVHNLLSGTMGLSLLRELDAGDTVSSKSGENASGDSLNSRVLQAAVRLVFGGSASIESWSAEALSEKLGASVPFLSADAVPGASLLKRLKAPGREMLATEAGSVLFWMEADGASRDALDFIRTLLSQPAGSAKTSAIEESTRMRRRVQSAATAGDDIELNEVPPVVFLVVQLPNEGATWLRVAGTDKAQHNLKLSIAMLLQLLGSVQPWRTKTLVTKRALEDAQRAQADEQEKFAAELAKRSAELEEMKESYVTTLDGAKVKYKSIVTEKSGCYRKSEKIFTETLTLAQSLRGQMLDKQIRPESTVSSVLETLLRFSKTAQPLTGMQISVAQCATSAVADSTAQVPEVPQLPSINRNGSAGRTQTDRNRARSAGNKNSSAGVQGFAAEVPSGLQWFTEQPSLGGRRALSLPVPQHAAIRVELYGGQAHTNPLQIALATGRVIIFLPVEEPSTGIAEGGGEGADPHSSLRESLLSICRKLSPPSTAEASKDSNTAICLNPTAQFPLFSMIVPIVLPGVDSTVLVVVRPADPSNAEEVSKYILYSLLCGILSLKQASRDLVTKKLQDREIASKCKNLALVGMKRALEASNLSRATLALVFEKMKSAKLSAQVATASSTVSTVQPQLSAARAQVRQLEQVSADWTEMVKGINGASGGIVTGVTGLWAQACPTLMNMLASNITVRGCGLLVTSGARDKVASSESLVEYTVRELNTPLAHLHPASSMFSPGTVGEMEDYAHGALECRPASDLGSSVVNLVQDILTGRTGNQRIFKLSRTRNGGYATSSGSGAHAGAGASAESETSLWLVPVRTARSVLGVLRVTVEVHPVGTPPAAGAQTPSRLSKRFATETDQPHAAVTVAAPNSIVTPATSLITKQKRLEEMVREQTEMLEEAQSNMINFSEVLAPLFFAAQQLDKANQKNSRLEGASQQSTAQAKAMTQEVQQVTKKSTLLAGVIKAVGSLCTAELNLPFTTPEECLRVFCNRIALLLSERLAGRVVISIHRNILSAADDSAASDSADTRPEADSITELLLDNSGKPFGRISFIPSKESLAAAAAAGKEASAAEAGPRNLYASLSKTGPNASVSYVLLPLAHILSGLLLRTAKEIAAKAQVTAAAENIRALEEALLQEQDAVASCQQKNEEQTVSNEFYRGLADIINQCLVYCSSEQEERLKYLGNGETYTFSLCSALQESLAGLCVKLPALVGHSCVFNFALLDSKSTIVDGDGEALAAGDRRRHNVTWVTAGGYDNVAFIDWRRMSQDARDILANLAHTCIAKKTKSACDIGVNLNRDANSSVLSVQKFTNVRVLSYPLLDQNTSAVLGVVQCLLDPSSQRAEVENLCEDVANSVSCMLSVEVQQQRLCGRTQTQKLALLALEMKSAENGQLKEIWQQRCRAWHALCLLASTITSSTVAATDVSEVIGSNAVIAMLSDAGIRLTVRSSSSVQAYRHVLGTGTKNILAHALLPIADSGDLVAEIVCERPALDTSTGSLVPPENQGIVAIAADLVETTTEILRSAVSIHKIRQMEMHETAKYSASAQHKMDKLKHELRQAREQLQLTTQQHARTIEDLAQQVQKYDSLRTSTAQAVTQFCTPAVSELTAQLQEMCAGPLKDAGVDDKDLLRDLTNLSKSLGGKDGKGTGFGEAKSPDSDDPAQFSSALVKPMSEMVAALKTSLTRVAALQKQRKQAETLSKQLQTDAASSRQPTADQQQLLNESAEQVEHTLQQLSRARKVHRVVCREASALLDPPFLNSIVGRSGREGLNASGVEEARVGHPAALSPLAASQDCCMKLLNMIRTLLRTEGQSLLLRDPGTDPVTYQVIYTGDSLHWAGIEQGTFGVVSSSKGFVSANGTMRTSLAETAMHTRKPIQTPNAPMDPRYYAYIDGICDLGTPILMVPMRGRGGTVVGVLIAARGKDAQPFSAEDIVAAEICSTLGALSLYWCQGMGQLHHQLSQYTTKTNKLERMLEKLQEKAEK